MEKLTLQGYYDRLTKQPSPSTEFVANVALKTGRSVSTVISWVTGKSKPRDVTDCIVLSQMTQIPVEDLFPMSEQ